VNILWSIWVIKQCKMTDKYKFFWVDVLRRMTWINKGAHEDHASSKSWEGSRRYSPAPYDLATSDPIYLTLQSQKVSLK
jgi:hypothetical protein